VKKSLLINTFAIILQAAIQLFILQKFLTLYTPGLYGEVSIYILLIAAFQIFSEGSIINQVLKTQCDKNVQELYGQSLIVSVIVMFLFWVAFLVTDYSHYELLLVYFIISISSIYKFFNQSKRRFTLVAFGDVLSSVNYLIFVLFTIKEHGVLSIIYGQIIFYLTMGLVNLTIHCKSGSNNIIIPKLDVSTMKNMDSYYQIGERLMNYASANLEKFVIPVFLGKEIFGLYFAAYQVAIFPVMKFNQIFSKVLNSYSKVMSQKDVVKLNLRIALFFLVFMTLFLVLYFLNFKILSSFFNSEWKSIFSLLNFLFILTFFKLIMSPLFQILLSIERYKLIFKLNVILLFLNLMALLVGVLFLEDIQSYLMWLVVAQFVYFSLVVKSTDINFDLIVEVFSFRKK
jgi:O-antigen/teichoic acid export membrane protein